MTFSCRLSQGWVIEPIDPVDDLDAVVRIEHASFPNPWTREMFEHEIEHTTVSHIIVIRTPAARVAGYCVFWVVFDEIHVNNLAVRPQERRAGLGRELLRAALVRGAALGGRQATLEVRRSNQAAIRLYGSFGFRVQGVRTAYYSNPIEDALVLGLDSLSGVVSEG
jgi:ribosomal-protein-alanine N-acetyltransferase